MRGSLHHKPDTGLRTTLHARESQIGDDLTILQLPHINQTARFASKDQLQHWHDELLRPLASESTWARKELKYRAEQTRVITSA